MILVKVQMSYPYANNEAVAVKFDDFMQHQNRQALLQKLPLADFEAQILLALAASDPDDELSVLRHM